MRIDYLRLRHFISSILNETGHSELWVASTTQRILEEVKKSEGN